MYFSHTFLGGERKLPGDGRKDHASVISRYVRIIERTGREINESELHGSSVRAIWK